MRQSSSFAAIALLFLCHCDECVARPAPPTGKGWQPVAELDGDSLDARKGNGPDRIAMVGATG